jgi:CheY-like chemotaxis protein
VALAAWNAVDTIRSQRAEDALRAMARILDASVAVRRGDERSHERNDPLRRRRRCGPIRRRRVLRRNGFGVPEAGTGEEALCLVKEAPDLVVLDVRLPDLNGFEVCRRINADPETCSIPALHLSAACLSSQATGREGGADAYLTQPVAPQVLLATADPSSREDA